MEESFFERGMLAVRAYLDHVGMLVADQGKKHFIAYDADRCVYVKVEVSKPSQGIPNTPAERTIKSYLKQVAAWGAKHGATADMQYAVDLVTIMVIADDKALLRHHRNIG